MAERMRLKLFHTYQTTACTFHRVSSCHEMSDPPVFYTVGILDLVRSLKLDLMSGFLIGHVRSSCFVSAHSGGSLGCLVMVITQSDDG